MSEHEKTWWMQTQDNPDRLLRVKLISRKDGWVCLETAKPVKTDMGWAMEAYAMKEDEFDIEAYAMKEDEFDITWRTWNIVPTRGMMEHQWEGRKPGNARAGGM